MIHYQSMAFGQRHPAFGYEDLLFVRKISRLATTHRRLCEMDANGEGHIRGKYYKADNPSAYVGEETVFFVEIENIEGRISALIQAPFSVTYQGNCREKTVKLFYENERIQLS